MVFLTLIVISMVNVSSSDEKIARNSRDKDLAFAAAEAALRDAELYVSGSYQFPYAVKSISAFTNTCANALCDLLDSPATYPKIESLDFFGGSGLGSKSNALGTTTGSPLIKGVANQPRYLIEVVNVTNDPMNTVGYEFRITAQAEGKSTDTRVTLQELYKPSWMSK